MKPAILAVLIAFTLTGCAHVMEEQIAALHVEAAPYEEIRDSGKHLGKTVMLGGVVSATTSGPEGGQIEVIQYPLTDEGYPDAANISAGRFLITSPTPLDPAVYPQGASIIVIGEVKSNRNVTSAWGTVRLPVLSLRTAHTWKAEQEKPQPFLVPGTNRIDPYYTGYGVERPKRPLGSKTDIW